MLKSFIFGGKNNINEPLKIIIENYEDPSEYDSDEEEKEISLNEYSQKLNERLKRIFCNKYRFNELKEKFNDFAENFGKFSSDKNNTLIYLNNTFIEKIIDACEFHFLHFTRSPVFCCIDSQESEKRFSDHIADALENLDKLNA